MLTLCNYSSLFNPLLLEDRRCIALVSIPDREKSAWSIVAREILRSPKRDPRRGSFPGWGVLTRYPTAFCLLWHCASFLDWSPLRWITHEKTL